MWSSCRHFRKIWSIWTCTRSAAPDTCPGDWPKPTEMRALRVGSYDAVRRGFAGEDGSDAGDQDIAHADAGADGRAALVWLQEDVGKLQVAAVEIRFTGENVEAGRGDSAALQGWDQGVVVDHVAPADIDHDRAL